MFTSVVIEWLQGLQEASQEQFQDLIHRPMQTILLTFFASAGDLLGETPRALAPQQVHRLESHGFAPYHLNGPTIRGSGNQGPGSASCSSASAPALGTHKQDS